MKINTIVLGAFFLLLSDITLSAAEEFSNKERRAALKMWRSTKGVLSQDEIFEQFRAMKKGESTSDDVWRLVKGQKIEREEISRLSGIPVSLFHGISEFPVTGEQLKIFIESAHKDDFDGGNVDEKRKIIWVLCAQYKPESGAVRSFSDIEDHINDLLSKAHDKGIAPHTFGEWFDGLPAGNSTVKAIHLLTKIMGLSDSISTQAVSSGLSYDDYESTVDAGAESADPESSIRDALRRHIPGLGTTGTGDPAAAAASSGYGVDFAGHAAGATSDISFLSVNPMHGDKEEEF
jgi:hypothetical protein